MRKMLWLRFVLAIVFVCVFPLTVSAAEEKCRPMPAAPVAAVAALVDKINGIGLTEYGRHLSPWPAPHTSPFVAWYTRFLVAMGTETPPSPAEQRAAATLVREVQSLPGTTLDASVWVDSIGATYSAADANQLKDVLCINTVTTTRAMGEQAATPVDMLMRNWLSGTTSAAGTDLLDPDGFVNELSHAATRLSRKISHPFNALTALVVHAQFAQIRDAWPKWISIPYYDAGKVHGIHLSSSSGISLYLFTGKTDDLAAFAHAFYEGAGDTVEAEQRREIEHWKILQKQFKPTTIAVSPLNLLIYGRKGFVPILDDQEGVQVSYGTTVTTAYNPFTGLEQSDLLMRGSQLTLATVAGVEGSDAPRRMTVDMWTKDFPPAFTVRSSVMYFVVDDHTSVILVEGYSPST